MHRLGDAVGVQALLTPPLALGRTKQFVQPGHHESAPTGESRVDPVLLANITLRSFLETGVTGRFLPRGQLTLNQRVGRAALGFPDTRESFSLVSFLFTPCSSGRLDCPELLCFETLNEPSGVVDEHSTLILS